ncbi:MAG: tyrosine-type recombinase/integrase [Syntrophobacteraceae bacterium]
MGTDRKKVKKYAGVYYREHSTRKHDGKPDKCFEINFRVGGDLHWEKIGWLSEGYSAQSGSQIRGDRIRTLRHGEELPTRKKEPRFEEIWKKYHSWAKTSRKSFSAELNRYEKHLEPRFGKKRLSEITPLALEELKSELTAKSSDQTIKHILVLVRQIINKAIAWDLWQGINPVKKIKLPNPNNQREKYLEPEQAEKILEELGKISPQWRDIAFLSLSTGMRPKEIFDLKWNDLNFADGIIYILDPKPVGRSESEKVYMNEELERMFKTRKDQIESQKDKKEEFSPDQHIFQIRRKIGGKITEVSDTFQRVVDALGFNKGVIDRRQKITFYTCRHTFASWLALEGVPILTIQKLMRHSNITMTMRYAHLSPSHEKSELAKLQNRMVRYKSDLT